MSMVRLDLDAGTAHFGDRSVSFEKEADDSLVLAGGSRIRPITFGERLNLLACAQIAAEPIDSFVARIRNQALVREGQDPDGVVALFALVLAGAHHSRHACSQSITAIMAAHRWTYETLLAKPARDIDRMALDLAPAQPNPWHRWVFPQEDLNDPKALAQFLARQLLERQPEDVDSQNPVPNNPIPLPQNTAASSEVAATPGEPRSMISAKVQPQPNVTPGSNTKTAPAEAEEVSPWASASGFRGVRAAIRASRKKLEEVALDDPPGSTHAAKPAATPTTFKPSTERHKITNEQPNHPLPDQPTTPSDPMPPMPDRFSPAIALPPPGLPPQPEESHSIQKPATANFPPPPIPFPKPPTVTTPSVTHLLRSTGRTGIAQAVFAQMQPPPRLEAESIHTAPKVQNQRFRPQHETQPFQGASKVEDLAQEMADLLHLEADLRGLLP